MLSKKRDKKEKTPVLGIGDPVYTDKGAGKINSIYNDKVEVVLNSGLPAEKYNFDEITPIGENRKYNQKNEAYFRNYKTKNFKEESLDDDFVIKEFDDIFEDDMFNEEEMKEDREYYYNEYDEDYP